MNTASTHIQVQSPVPGFLGSLLALCLGPVGWLFGLIAIVYSLAAVRARSLGDEIRASRYQTSATASVRFGLYGTLISFGVGMAMMLFVMFAG